MTKHYTPNRTRTPSTRHWVTFTAMTFLFGCGSPDADVAAPGFGDTQAEPSDSATDLAASSEETGLLGAGNSALSADEKGRSGESSPDPITNHRSGTRIQAQLLITEEDQLTAQGWRDTQLGENCTFERDDQGTLRCFPVGGTDQLYYSNASCSRPFVRVEASDERAEPVNYYYYHKDTACGEGIRAYELADTIEVPAMMYERNGDGCVAVAPTGHAYRALGAPIDPSRFVAAEYGVIDAPGRVKGYGLIAEDGAIALTGFVDEELDTNCMWADTASAETAACVPNGPRIERFADPELSVPLMTDGVASCDEPMATVGAHYGTGGSIRYYRRGERFEGDTVYGMVPQVVNGPAAIAAQEPYFQTEEIPASQLAQATLSMEVTSRLNPVYWNAGDGKVWFSRWYDLALGSNCTFVTDASGEALCLPDTTGNRVLYADSSCNQPVAEVDADCGAARPQFAAEHVKDEKDQPKVNIRRLLTATALQSVYGATEAGCVERHARTDKQYFDLSDPLPAATFVSAKPAPGAETAPGGDTPATDNGAGLF